MSDQIQMLEEQVRTLTEKTLAQNALIESQARGLSNQRSYESLAVSLQGERDVAVQRAEKLKQELAGESKARRDAERLLAALERELAVKDSRLERYQAESDLSELLGKAEPLLGALHEAVLSLSKQDS